MGKEKAPVTQRLQEGESLLRSLLDLSSDWFWEQDEQFRFVRMEGRGIRHMGAAVDEHLGRTPWDLPCLNLTAEDWARHRAALERHEPFYELELQRPAADGRTAWVSISGAPIIDAGGRFRGYRGIGRDISAQKRAEEDLLRFRMAMDESADLILLIDRATMRYIDVNKTACRMLGYTREELLGIDIHELLGVDRASLEAAYDRFIESPDNVEGMRGRYRRKDGSTFAFESTRHVLRSGDRKIIAAISRDITERESADEDRRLRESELARFQAAMDASPDMIYITDRDAMRFVYVNEAACRLAGFTREEFLALGPSDLLRTTPGEVEAMLDRVIAAGSEGTVEEVKSRTKDGLRTMVELRRRAVHLDGRWLVVTHAHDISARKRAEQATLRLSRMFSALSATNEAILRAKSPADLYRRVCEAAVDGGKFLTTAVIEPGADGVSAKVLAASGSAAGPLREATIALSPETAEGRGLVGTAFQTGAPCISNDFATDPRTAPWHESSSRAGVAAGAAIPVVRDGKTTGVLLFYSGEKRAFDPEIVRLLERMAENIVFALDNFDRETERRRAEERIQYLASHDSLTGLPNRAMFATLLGHAIDGAQRYARTFAVLFIDLDRFKVINDTLGHQAGDELLQLVAAALKKSVRASDVVARLGGDEFVVLVQEVQNRRQVSTVARKILSAMIRPLRLAGQEVRVTASVGVSMFPEHAKDESGLMRCADLAMYAAKEQGKNNFQIYSSDIRSPSLERMSLETHLRRALAQDELSLHFQAKQDLRDGAVTGVEALLRWDNPHLGPVSPAQFIPLAEETGLIVPIGRWVLRRACAQHMAWRRAGLPPVHVAVNLSPRQFAAPDLLSDIDEALAASGMSAEFLELEITEGMVMHNAERAVALLGEIKKRGIRLAIDDFGTGYSSLAQLKRFPIDTLKIDRSFIRDLPQDAEDRAITEAIIAMGKTIGLTVVAEGVETAEQRAFLRERACDELQGYYFSRPLPPGDCEAFLRQAIASTSEPCT